MENQINQFHNFLIEIEQEEDGRWIAEINDLPGVLVYGNTKKEAISNVKALALRVIADNTVIKQIKQLRKNIALDKNTIQELREEGRRF